MSPREADEKGRMMDNARVRDAFAGAADYFVATVARVPADEWERPGLGEWSVRALVGHTSRALLTVETYLAAGAARVDVPGPAEYFMVALTPTVDHSAIAERGRQAGAALGDDPAGAVRTLAERVVARVQRAADTDLVGTPAGGMTLSAYLPTRVFELAIHTLDLAAALGVAGSLPDAAAAVTLDLVAALARRRGRDTELLLAATGRGALPAGYTVLR
jgi:uncharacterized protein (TIGR03083 family)